MGAVKARIEKDLPGVYVYSVRLGDTIAEDMAHGFYGNVNEQVAEVCQSLAGNPLLAEGYSAVGFSQGGQFLRAVAQRCPQPAMQKLVTMGAQHEGVSTLPGCNISSSVRECQEAADLVARDAYAPWVGLPALELCRQAYALSICATHEQVRDHVVQAQYFKSPPDRERYLKYNPFLPVRGVVNPFPGSAPARPVLTHTRPGMLIRMV